MTDEANKAASSDETGAPLAPRDPSVDPANALLEAEHVEGEASAPAPADAAKVNEGDALGVAPPVGVPAKALPARGPSFVFLAVVSALSLAVDLGTKAWAVARLDDLKPWSDRRIDVIPHCLSFVFAKNRGGAWGLLQNESESIRRPFFLGISFLAILFIVSLYRRLTPQQTALKWGLPLVLGGALGNLINRIQHNYVVDFIDAYSGQNHWPTFNIADIAICIGVGLMVIDMFQTRRKPLPGAGPSIPAPKQT